MKKTILLLAVAALFCACSKDANVAGTTPAATDTTTTTTGAGSTSFDINSIEDTYADDLLLIIIRSGDPIMSMIHL